MRIGVAYQIYVLTGSTLASAGALLVSLLPKIVLGSIAGVYADRWDRRWTMIGANLLMAVALLPLFAVRSAGQAWLIYAVMAVHACVAPFFSAAEASLVPTLVGGDRLVRINSLNGQVSDIARLIGAALGGTVAALGGIPLLGAVDVGTFLLAAGLLFLLRVRPERTNTVRPDVLHEWSEGLHIALANRALRVFLIFGLITGVGEAAIGTLAAPFVRDVLGGDARAYGMIMSSQAIGGLAGGLIVTLVGHRFPPRAMFVWGTVAFGLIDLALFTYPLLDRVLWPAVVLIVAAGLPAAFIVAGGMTVFQQATEDRHRGRVWGAFTAVDATAMLVGTVAAGSLAGRWGVLPVISVQSVAYTAAGIVVLLALPHRLTSSPDAPSPQKTRAEPARNEPAVGDTDGYAGRAVRNEPARNEPSGDEPSGDEPSGDEHARDEHSRNEPAREEPAPEEPARDDLHAPAV
ncbi:MFS transporter [Winogradskya humida]|uniref:MFS transporter n=1 Tax=Winogradskya humida TaxID=113566 RepID=A0ABQ3ZTI3_9ACTN|nr:MFS transporter [Actinoplanes humidus]